MSFRVPRFSHLHAVRDRGWAHISLDGDSADTDFPVQNLVDDRNGTRFKFTGTPANPNFDINLGADFVDELDRLIIPPDHIFETLKVIEAADAAFTTPTTLHDTDTTVTPGAQINLEFDTNISSKRYIRILSTGAAANYYCTQLFLTKTVTLVRGPNLEDSPDGFRANVTRIEQPTGLSPTVQHGPQQRILEYDYESPLSGADLIAMEAFIADVGLTHPFYVDPHSFSATPAVDDPPICMKFVELPISRLAVTVPHSGIVEKTFNLKLIESLD